MIRYIDLFCGMGGMRLGFEQACIFFGHEPKCVFSSDIKPHAVSIYGHNFGDVVHGDITRIKCENIPDFDFLLGGFPCQAFSINGKRLGFDDIRGKLFYDIARILKHKNPQGFLLENVDGLVGHDGGRTLSTIMQICTMLGYKVTYKVLDSKNFGVAQSRKRIYIIGSKLCEPKMRHFPYKHVTFGDIMENDNSKNNFCTKLKNFGKDYAGKCISDTRTGKNYIHSWDLQLNGVISKEQSSILSMLISERRKKKWSQSRGVPYKDGIPLTLDEIYSAYKYCTKKDLKSNLDHCVKMGYIIFDGSGYNIIRGRLSFEINRIISKDCITNAIIATGIGKIAVVDGDNLRLITEREHLRLFGFPEYYQSNLTAPKLYDLIGNTVVIPVIFNVAKCLLEACRY